MRSTDPEQAISRTPQEVTCNGIKFVPYVAPCLACQEQRMQPPGKSLLAGYRRADHKSTTIQVLTRMLLTTMFSTATWRQQGALSSSSGPALIKQVYCKVFFGCLLAYLHPKINTRKWRWAPCPILHSPDSQSKHRLTRWVSCPPHGMACVCTHPEQLF